MKPVVAYLSLSLLLARAFLVRMECPWRSSAPSDVI